MHADEIRTGLDDSVPAFSDPLTTVLKESAVKQETERLVELQTATLRCMALLNRLASSSTAPKFSALIATTTTGKFSERFRELCASAEAQRASNESTMQID